MCNFIDYFYFLKFIKVNNMFRFIIRENLMLKYDNNDKLFFMESRFLWNIVNEFYFNKFFGDLKMLDNEIYLVRVFY